MHLNAYVSEHIGRDAIAAPARLESYIRSNSFDRPTLVVDSVAIAHQFRALKRGLGDVAIHYAVKANPEPAVLRVLLQEGANFDAASRSEIALCLSLGATPDRISFGNTIKRASDIAWAYEHGIRLFAADAEEELHKLGKNAPGANVFIRIVVDATGADWPLSRKFGCAPDKAISLFELARQLGLNPVGLSFHVGSQTREPAMWVDTLDQVQQVWQAVHQAGFQLSLLNIGGGFPASYDKDVPHPSVYSAMVMELVHARFPGVPHIIAEPGRGLVAEAGMIACEVLLVSKKSEKDPHRWVYLDIGKFSGLAETMDESIRYRFVTDKDEADHGPCVVAGPSCDSADVLYEKQHVALPESLCAGDRVMIRSCGAYTSTYASVGFNGFPPLDVVVI
ncbi:type III PLP-dependent enzyme [Pseudovibrio exalbescens]|nr:type III PLP-dependent enzyme [Pseudovibrio exalbescens]MDD7909198.1 type III PLP-dependent enzyme [Pseudovibrio exalbescens]